MKMKNTVSIPHLGASTKESEQNCAVMAARQIKEYLNTGNVCNSVNFPEMNLPYTGKRRIAIFHKNVPNMVKELTTVISTYDLNIADMMNRSKGIYAYTLIDIDQNLDNKTFAGLKQGINRIKGIITNRII